MMRALEPARVDIRTYHRLAFFIHLKRAFPVTNEEGKVEQILDRLPKIIWVNHEFKEIHGAGLL